MGGFDVNGRIVTRWEFQISYGSSYVNNCVGGKGENCILNDSICIGVYEC